MRAANLNWTDSRQSDAATQLPSPLTPEIKSSIAVLSPRLEWTGDKGQQNSHRIPHPEFLSVAV
jgi:hypothetical protein